MNSEGTLGEVDDNEGLKGSIQKVVEDNLNDWLSIQFQLWRDRPELRAHVLLGVLYKARNWLFNIRASSKRPMIKNFHENNILALEEMFNQLQKDEVKVISYIPPFPNIEPHPYIESEYSHFKRQIATLAHLYGVKHLDLEGVVPVALWGNMRGTAIGVESEMDYMHFTAPGHRLLAEELLSAVNSVF